MTYLLLHMCISLKKSSFLIYMLDNENIIKLIIPIIKPLF